MVRNFLDVGDLSCGDLDAVLGAAALPLPELPRAMEGCSAALVFEKPSLRTRNAAEMAVVALGGHPVYIQDSEVGIAKREEPEDIAMVLAEYHSAICARVMRHETLERMAQALDGYEPHVGRREEVPVVNLLSDLSHPSQAVADMLTIQQTVGGPEGKVLAYIGDANNVCRSLMEIGAMKGMRLRAASPPGYGLDPDDLERIGRLGGEVEVTTDPAEAAAGADVIYTDVWTSMGDEGEAEIRREVFKGYTVDEELLGSAGRDAVVMHCLPAHRGEEITGGVLNGPQSVAFRQAGNRLPAVAAILLWTFGAIG